MAFIGSGSLGKGTLRSGGAAHPFRIGGLGIVVQWESDYQSGLQNVQDGTKKVWDGTKEGTRKAVDAVKKPFQ